MTTPQSSLPVIGQPCVTEDAKVLDCLTAYQQILTDNVDTSNFALGAVPGTKLAAAAAIADTQLASPNNAVPQFLLVSGGSTSSIHPPASNSATVGLAYGGTWVNLPSASFPTPWATTGAAPRTWTYRAADYAVAGKTARFSLRVTAVAASAGTFPTVVVPSLIGLTVSAGNYGGSDPGPGANSISLTAANMVATGSYTVNPSALYTLTDGRSYLPTIGLGDYVASVNVALVVTYA